MIEVMATNTDEVKGHDTSGFNETTDSEQISDKFELFELQLNRLSSAKQELVSFIRSEKESIIKKYENIVEVMKQDFKTKENHFQQTIDKLNEDHNEYQKKTKQEINDLSVHLRQSTQESMELKQSVIDLQSVVRHKDSDLNKIQNELNKSENDLKFKTNEFKSQLSELNNKLLEMTVNRDSTQKELNSLKTKLNSLELENQSIKSSLLLANEKNQSLENKCETLSSENQRLRQSLDFEQKAKYESMETIRSLTNSLNDNQKEIERLQKNWSDLEKSRISEINCLRQEINQKEQEFKEQINRLTQEKTISDKKSVSDVNSLIQKLKETNEELNRIKTIAERDRHEMETTIREKDSIIGDLESDKTRIETEMSDKITKMLKELEETTNNLSEMTAKREKVLSQLTQTKTQLIAIENEKEVLKTSLVKANEKCYSLEFQIDSLNTEIEKYKQLLENGLKEKKEKTQMFETITDSLRERQTEVERLNKLVKEMEKNCKEFEGSRSSIMDDCNELRSTLMEVEKSRLDIKRELNNYKISNSSLENKLKSKDNEIQDLKSRLEALKEERNALKDSFDSCSKSLSQLREINANLSQRNKQLTTQMSFNESERREFERKLSSSCNAITDRESDVSYLKKDNQMLRERVNKLENEKKRLERSYSLIEKEKSVLKTTLEDIQRKSNKTFETSVKNDGILDEAKIITQGLAALELKNIELQRKVQGLQSLMNEAENSNNGTDSFTSFHQTNGHIVNQTNDSVKLRLAQKHAENLIDRKDISGNHLSNLEKELSRYSLSPSLTKTPPRFKEPPNRSHSVSKLGGHQNTDTSTPLPLYSSASGSQNVKRKLNYNKN